MSDKTKGIEVESTEAQQILEEMAAAYSFNKVSKVANFILDGLTDMMKEHPEVIKVVGIKKDLSDSFNDNDVVVKANILKNNEVNFELNMAVSVNDVVLTNKKDGFGESDPKYYELLKKGPDLGAQKVLDSVARVVKMHTAHKV